MTESLELCDLGFSAGSRGVSPLTSVEIGSHPLAFQFSAIEITHRPEPKALAFTFPLPGMFPAVNPRFRGTNGKGKQTPGDKYFGRVVFLCVWVCGKYSWFPYRGAALASALAPAGSLWASLCASRPLPPLLGAQRDKGEETTEEKGLCRSSSC